MRLRWKNTPKREEAQTKQEEVRPRNIEAQDVTMCLEEDVSSKWETMEMR